MIEGVARRILRAGEQHDEDAPDVAELVRILLGADAARYLPPGIDTPRGAPLVRVGGRWRILVPRDLSVEVTRVRVARALVRWWWTEREPCPVDDIDWAIERVAAAVICPTRSLRRALLRHGRDLAAIAEEYGAPETLVALREAEILGLRRAVVTPDLVRTRGPVGWPWPPDTVLRLWAASGGPGVRRVPLSDGAGVVIDVGT